MQGIVNQVNNPRVSCYQAIKAELEHLGSLALADSLGTSNQLMYFLKSVLSGYSTILVNEYVWNLFPSEEDKKYHDHSIQFPFEQFLNLFLLTTEKRIFILPALIKQAHFIGIVFSKNANKLILHYFNPTGMNPPQSGEDNEALNSIKLALKKLREKINKSISMDVIDTYKDELIGNLNQQRIELIKNEVLKYLASDDLLQSKEILSDQQQINGCDCVYIVGQSLVEIAQDKPLSIKKFNASNISEYVKPIAAARANFCRSEVVGEVHVKTTIRDQLLSRLGTALTLNYENAKEIRAFIKKEADDQEYQLAFEIMNQLKTTIQRIEMKDGFKEVEGTLLVDKVTNYLTRLPIIKKVDLTELKKFCDQLLEPYFPEHGDIIFTLNQKLKVINKNEASDEKLARELQAQEYQKSNSVTKEIIQSSKNSSTQRNEFNIKKVKREPLLQKYQELQKLKQQTYTAILSQFRKIAPRAAIHMLEELTRRIVSEGWDDLQETQKQPGKKEITVNESMASRTIYSSPTIEKIKKAINCIASIISIYTQREDKLCDFEAIKEQLFILSWRFNEISWTDKFSFRNIIAEREVISLDNLSNILCNKDNKLLIEFYLSKIVNDLKNLKSKLIEIQQLFTIKPNHEGNQKKKNSNKKDANNRTIPNLDFLISYYLDKSYLQVLLDKMNTIRLKYDKYDKFDIFHKLACLRLFEIIGEFTKKFSARTRKLLPSEWEVFENIRDKIEHIADNVRLRKHFEKLSDPNDFLFEQIITEDFNHIEEDIKRVLAYYNSLEKLYLDPEKFFSELTFPSLDNKDTKWNNTSIDQLLELLGHKNKLSQDEQNGIMRLTFNNYQQNIYALLTNDKSITKQQVLEAIGCSQVDVQEIPDLENRRQQLQKKFSDKSVNKQILIEEIKSIDERLKKYKDWLDVPKQKERILNHHKLSPEEASKYIEGRIISLLNPEQKRLKAILNREEIKEDSINSLDELSKLLNKLHIVDTEEIITEIADKINYREPQDCSKILKQTIPKKTVDLLINRIESALKDIKQLAIIAEQYVKKNNGDYCTLEQLFNVSSVYYMAVEKLLEIINETTEKLMNDTDFINHTFESISIQQLSLLKLLRDNIAHRPIEVHSKQIAWFFHNLLTESSIDLHEHKEAITGSELVKALSDLSLTEEPSPNQTLKLDSADKNTLEELLYNHSTIIYNTARVFGINTDISLIISSLNENSSQLYIQSDINLLIELESFADTYSQLKFDWELSKLLRITVKSYTKEQLASQMGVKLTQKHYDIILKEKIPLYQIYRNWDLNKNLKENRLLYQDSMGCIHRPRTREEALANPCVINLNFENDKAREEREWALQAQKMICDPIIKQIITNKALKYKELISTVFFNLINKLGFNATKELIEDSLNKKEKNIIIYSHLEKVVNTLYQEKAFLSITRWQIKKEYRNKYGLISKFPSKEDAIRYFMENPYYLERLEVCKNTAIDLKKSVEDYYQISDKIKKAISPDLYMGYLDNFVMLENALEIFYSTVEKVTTDLIKNSFYKLFLNPTALSPSVEIFKIPFNQEVMEEYRQEINRLSKNQENYFIHSIEEKLNKNDFVSPFLMKTYEYYKKEAAIMKEKEEKGLLSATIEDLKKFAKFNHLKELLVKKNKG